MSYTIGIKRRFLPGYRRVQVLGHSWENFRFLLNMADGSQLIIPGFRVDSVKVYADFNDHFRAVQEVKRLAAERAHGDMERKKLEHEIEQLRAAKERGYSAPAPFVAAPRQQILEPEAPRIEYQPPTLQQEFYGTEPVQQPAPMSEQEQRARANAQKRLDSIFGSDGQATGLAPRSALS